MGLHLQLFKERVAEMYGFRKTNWEDYIKTYENENNVNVATKFVEVDATYPCILVIPARNSTVLLYQDETLPAIGTIKAKKYLACFRHSPETPLTRENYRNEILFSELNKSIIESMSNIFNDVYIPVLSNPKNQEGWSDLVSKDLMEKFHGFLAHTYVTIGQVKGRTLLPLPPNDTITSDRTNSKDKAHIFEGCIITWTKQIKMVLKQDPEAALKQGQDPDPL